MEWKEYPRADGRMEYMCEHGVGHGTHLHGCDGCCSRDDFPSKFNNLRIKLLNLRHYYRNLKSRDIISRIKMEETVNTITEMFMNLENRLNQLE